MNKILLILIAIILIAFGSYFIYTHPKPAATSPVDAQGSITETEKAEILKKLSGSAAAPITPEDKKNISQSLAATSTGNQVKPLTPQEKATIQSQLQGPKH